MGGGTLVGDKPSKARVRAGHQTWERMKKDARVSLADVRRARRFGHVAESLKPLAVQAERELGELLADKGEAVTAAERVVLEDVARLGLLLRAEFARYLKSGDQTSAARVTALAGQRRSSLAAVGLDRRSREIQLEDYIDAKASEEKP